MLLRIKVEDLVDQTGGLRVRVMEKELEVYQCTKKRPQKNLEVNPEGPKHIHMSSWRIAQAECQCTLLTKILEEPALQDLVLENQQNLILPRIGLEQDFALWAHGTCSILAKLFGLDGRSARSNIRADERIMKDTVMKTKATDYGNIKWIEDLVPNRMWSQVPVSYEKHALWESHIRGENDNNSMDLQLTGNLVVMSTLNAESLLSRSFRLLFSGK
ncbi:hypothetical protein Tco_0885643 [Tanacetum coccineum]